MVNALKKHQETFAGFLARVGSVRNELVFRSWVRR